MNISTAEQQKAFIAEKHLAIVRALVIAFGTIVFFLLNPNYIKKEFAYILLGIIWVYGGFVLYFKPYEKYPVFLAAWFTYVSDCVLITLSIYTTGGFYSPFHVLFYPSIIGVAYRFGLNTTFFPHLFTHSLTLS